MIIGIDIGGDSIKAVRLNKDGAFEKKMTRPTGRGQPAELKDRVFRIVSEVAGDHKPEAIGIGVCGLVDCPAGKVKASVALPRLRNCQICDKLENFLGIPVKIFKDSIMATYGEWQLGVAKGKENAVLFSVGANVSGGAITGSKLVMGHSGNFGGFGHISVDPQGPLCVCGNRGCVGILGSSNGLARHYRDITHVDKAPEEVSALILDGDENAVQALAQTARCLAIAVGAVINITDPQLVVISGGLSTLGQVLLEPLRREIMACVFPEMLADLDIECGALGVYAGAMGAALYVRDQNS